MQFSTYVFIPIHLLWYHLVCLSIHAASPLISLPCYLYNIPFIQPSMSIPFSYGSTPLPNSPS